jgi:hypothetical protein
VLDVQEVDDRIRRSAAALRAAGPPAGPAPDELRRTHRRRRTARRSLAAGAATVAVVAAGLVLDLGDLDVTLPGIDDGREAPEVAGRLPDAEPSDWHPGWPADHAGPASECEVSSEPSSSTSAPGWEALPAPPHVRDRPTLTWSGTELLLFAGETSSPDGLQPHDDLVAFDPTAGTWRCLPSGPPRRGGGWATTVPGAVDAGSLWVAADGVLGRFDLDEERWERGADLPRRRTPRALVRTEDRLLAFGSADTASDWTAEYDPSADRWTELPAAPIAPHLGVVAWTGEEVLVVEARGGSAYDPGARRWRDLPAWPLARVWFTGTWDGSRLVVVDHELRAAAYRPGTDTWTSLDSPPLEPVVCPTPEVVALADGTVVLWFCGQLALLDPGATAWRAVETPETASVEDGRQMPLWVPGSPVAAGDVVYVAGAGASGEVADTWRFDPADAAPPTASIVR